MHSAVSALTNPPSTISSVTSPMSPVTHSSMASVVWCSSFISWKSFNYSFPQVVSTNSSFIILKIPSNYVQLRQKLGYLFWFERTNRLVSLLLAIYCQTRCCTAKIKLPNKMVIILQRQFPAHNSDTKPDTIKKDKLYQKSLQCIAVYNA